MNVAVIGASGFVGGHLLRVLRERGDTVRAVVRNPEFARQDPDCRIADVCAVYELRDALFGCDYVVHAALGSPEVILRSIATVYAAAQAVGIKRLVYISTGSVHGQSPRPGTDETSRLTIFQPVPYNTAKVRAERRLMRLRKRGTVEVVILRPTIVIGPGSRWIFDFADALKDNRAYVIGGAQGICNSIYVDNLAHAVRLALLAPGVDREVFLVNDEETVTWADLYRPIAEAFGFRYDAVCDVPPPAPRSTVKQRYLEPIRSSELVRPLLMRVPPGLKAGIRSAVRGLKRLAAAAPAPTPAPAAAPSPAPGRSPSIDISAEMAALHCCRWRLPHDKARRMLGYHAPVSFAESCRRSIEWLNARDARKAAGARGSVPRAS